MDIREIIVTEYKTRSANPNAQYPWGRISEPALDKIIEFFEDLLTHIDDMKLMVVFPATEAVDRRNGKLHRNTAPLEGVYFDHNIYIAGYKKDPCYVFASTDLDPATFPEFFRFILDREDDKNLNNQGYVRFVYYMNYFWPCVQGMFQNQLLQLRAEFDQAYPLQLQKAIPLAKDHFVKIQKGRDKRANPDTLSDKYLKDKAAAIESFTKMLVQNHLASEVFTAEEVLNIVKTYRSNIKLIKAIGSWSNTHPRGNQLLDLEGVESAMKLAGIKRLLDC